MHVSIQHFVGMGSNFPSRYLIGNLPQLERAMLKFCPRPINQTSLEHIHDTDSSYLSCSPASFLLPMTTKAVPFKMYRIISFTTYLILARKACWYTVHGAQPSWITVPSPNYIHLTNATFKWPEMAWAFQFIMTKKLSLISSRRLRSYPLQSSYSIPNQSISTPPH